MEEARAAVLEAKLLGYQQICCLKGELAGLVRVRSFWKANVKLLNWIPQQEIEERKLVSTRNVLSLLPAIYEPIMARILVEAGVEVGA